MKGVVHSDAASAGPGATTLKPFSDRLLALDAVRAFAIILVAGHHLAYRVPFDFEDPFARIFRAAGYIGVDLFFALSGLLIVQILQKSPGPSGTLPFFARRLGRILPIFIVSICVFAVGAAAKGQWEELELLPLTALFLNGWMIPFLGVDGVPFTITWSLSVEVFGYLLLGLAARRSLSALWFMLTAMVIAAALARTALIVSAAVPVDTIYFFVPARIDAIAFGGLAAFGIFRSIDRHRYAPYLLGLTIVALIVVFRWIPITHWVMPAFGYPIFGIVAAAWVSSLANTSPQPPSLLTRVLAPIGLYSYFIYPFHLFLIEGIKIGAAAIGFTLSFYSAFALLIAIATAAGAVSWSMFERPIIEAFARRFKSVR